MTKTNTLSAAYADLLNGRRIAISFQTAAELLVADFSDARQQRLEFAVSNTVRLPHSGTTSLHYADVSRARALLSKSRELGRDAGDADMWIISSALRYDLRLVTHDRQQLALAEAAGVECLTALGAPSRGSRT